MTNSHVLVALLLAANARGGALPGPENSPAVGLEPPRLKRNCLLCGFWGGGGSGGGGGGGGGGEATFCISGLGGGGDG